MKTSQEFEFLGIKTNYYDLMDWAKVLTRSDPKLEQRFLDIYKKKQNFVITILQLRHELFAEGRGKIDKELLKQASIRNEELFAKLLEEMFLEPVSIGYVNVIQRIMKQNEWNVDDLIIEHEDDIERRVWRIISCRNKKSNMVNMDNGNNNTYNDKMIHI